MNFVHKNNTLIKIIALSKPLFYSFSQLLSIFKADYPIFGIFSLIFVSF